VVGLVDGQHRRRLDRPERPAPTDGLREEQPPRHVAGVAADDAEIGLRSTAVVTACDTVVIAKPLS
jgi:hypothetical protein